LCQISVRVVLRAAMIKSERDHVLVMSLMSDGLHRSFETIRVLVGLKYTRLQATLEDLVAAGWLELKYTRGSLAIYIITFKGLSERSNVEPPVYRL
jgi:hypothetical protein